MNSRGGRLSPCRAVSLSRSKASTGQAKPRRSSVLAAWLTRRGQEPVLLRQPGGTATGDRIREILLDSRSARPRPHDRDGPDVRRPRPGHRRGHSARSRRRQHRPLRPLHRLHRGLPGRRPPARLRNRARSAPPRLRRPAARPHASASARLRGLAGPRAPPQHPRRSRNRQQAKAASRPKRTPSFAASGRSTARSPPASTIAWC